MYYNKKKKYDTQQWQWRQVRKWMSSSASDFKRERVVSGTYSCSIRSTPQLWTKLNNKTKHRGLPQFFFCIPDVLILPPKKCVGFFLCVLRRNIYSLSFVQQSLQHVWVYKFILFVFVFVYKKKRDFKREQKGRGLVYSVSYTHTHAHTHITVLVCEQTNRKPN